MADRRLEVFHAVSKMMSFTKAAQMLQMTQPAVTFQIRQLEDHLNTRLFDRAHNKISLTEAGKKVFQYSEDIFSLYREMENAISQVTQTVGGTVRIGACQSWAEYFLPEMIAHFKKQNPDVNMTVKTADPGQVSSLVENGFVDIGIIDHPIDTKTLTAKQCFTDEMVVVVPTDHPLAQQTSVEWSQLIQQPWILRESAGGANESFFQYLKNNHYSPQELNIMMELGSSEAIKGAVEAGSGIAVLSRQAVQKEIRLGTLAAIELTPKFEHPFTLIYKAQKYQVRVLDELMQFVEQYFQRESTPPIPPSAAPSNYQTYNN